jgi:hypothetical protein
MTIATVSPILVPWPDGTYRTGSAPDGLFKLSGPYVDGEDITIESAVIDFGSRVQQTPLIWDTFAGGTDGQLLSAYDPTWQAYGGHQGALIGSGATARYAGGKYAYNTSARHEFDTNFKTFGASRSRFISYWWRTVDLEISGADEGVLKMCRLTSSAAIGGGGVYNGKGSHYLSALIPQNDGDPFVGYYNSAGTIVDGVGPGGSNEYFELPINEWCRIDMFVRMSEVNTPNGIFACNVLGGKEWERDDLIQNVSGQPELLLDSMILGLMQANAVGIYAQQITDVYMTDSRARFEVGTLSTYTACKAAKALEVQSYRGWSPLKVKLRGNTKKFGALVDKWLYYTDEDGVTNLGSNDGFYLGAF